MEILSYFDLFLGALLNAIFNVIIVKKVFNIKMINNKYKRVIIIVITALSLSIINVFNKSTFKGLLTFPIAAICISNIFEIKYTKSIYYTLVLSFYLLIGEVFSIFGLSILNIKYELLLSNFLGRTIGNIIVITFTFPLIYIKFISNIFKKIECKKINKKFLIFIFITFLIMGSAFAFKSTINVENIISSIMNIIIFLVFILLIYFSYLENMKLNKISDEYNSLFNYLDKYEKELNEKRKLIHDFKNQLIIINSYSENSNKLKDYLKDIIEEHKNIKETKIIKNIDKLPSGLKGLLYYKLSQIEDEIKINLNVNSKFKGFEKLNSKDNKNILKIIGILIDNAIESSINTELKYILIDISMNKGIFEMHMINSCEKNLEKSKIMELGFSTKGRNRGYGLSLVKDIIRNDDRYKLDLYTENNEFKTTFKMIIK